MGFREVSVVEVREVLRAWLEGQGLRRVAERAGVDRKTARRYVEAAQAAGLAREAGSDAVTDELIGLVVEAVRPARPGGHGAAWEALLEHEDRIRAWVSGGECDGVKHEPLSVVKIEQLLARQGVAVPYRTLHRFAVERCGFGTGRGTTVRVADGEPGVECQLDFAQMGLLLDPETGRRRKVHALIFTAVLSRHMFVWLSYAQTLTAVIAGCEAAWGFFGGAFKVLIPDNLTPVVPKADALTPRFSPGWLDYSQHVGFGTDPARVRSPQDKPRVERVVQYVRGNFWAGETFADLADAQARAEAWCREQAGMRIHGTTQLRPAEHFAATEAGCLLPVPAPYDQPIFIRVKVHRDFHVEVAKALYSVPEAHLGRYLDARADRELVKLYSVGAGGGRLVKTHPRQPPGGRSTDPGDLPEHKAGYAMRDLTRLIAVCAEHGPSIGIYAERILDDPLPWTRMRSVYRLQGLGDPRTDQNAHVTCDRSSPRLRRRGRTAGWLAAVVVIAGVVVAAWPHAQHFSQGLPPQQFRSALDPALLKDYPGVLGVAHNAANRLDTLQVALDHGADVVEADLISVRGELVAGRDQPMSWLTNIIFRGPTLAQVWDAAAPADMLKLDLKRDDTAFLDDLVTFLAPRQGSREVMVASRDRGAIVRLHRDLPEITVLLSIGFPEGVHQLRSDADLRAAISGVTIFQGLVDANLVEWLHERDLLVLAWPVNDVQRLTTSCATASTA